MIQTPQQQIANKLRELIGRAPAGGPFHTVLTMDPVCVDGGPSRFVIDDVIVNAPDGNREYGKFEITVTPLPIR